MLGQGILGRTVALAACPAHHERSGAPDRISGLYVVEEWLPYEPSAYVHEPGYLVYRHGHDDGDPWFVADDDLWAQVDPQAYGRSLELERWLEFHQDDAEEVAR